MNVDHVMAGICKDIYRKFIDSGFENFNEFTDALFQKPHEKQKCKACTAKGIQCSKYALEGDVYCSVHLKKECVKIEKKKKTTSSKKLYKHTHGLTSPVKNCKLCSTHGHMFEEIEYEALD